MRESATIKAMLNDGTGSSVTFVQKSRRGLVIAALIAGTVAVILALVVWFSPSARTSLLLGIARSFLPQELASTTFVADSPKGTKVYPGLRGVETSSGMLVSATQDASGTARITESADGVFSVFLDGKVILTDKKPRTTIARSPDGSRVAFAESVQADTFISPVIAPALSLERKNTNIVVYTPETRSSLTLGPGAAPVFTDATHLVWLAASGLARTDVTTGSTTILIPDTKSRIPALHLVSPDHTHIAWYTEGKSSFTVYRLTETGAERVSETTLPKPYFSVALGNDSFYVLRSRSGMAEVVKVAFGSADVVPVAHLPLGLKITRMLIGSF